jgi:hypothetical protein
MRNVVTRSFSVGTTDGLYRYGIISSEFSKDLAYVTIIRDYESTVHDSNLGMLCNAESMLQRAATVGDGVLEEESPMFLSALCELFPLCYQNGCCSLRLNAEWLDRICFGHIGISPN